MAAGTQIRRWAAVALLLLVGAPVHGGRPAEADPAGCMELCQLVAAGRLADLRWPDFPDYLDRVQAFYKPVDYALAWVTAGRPTPAARAMIAVLAEADSKGLNPEDYDASRWAARIAALEHPGAREEAGAAFDAARFDLALTVSVMRYVSDLHFGKLNPGMFHNGFDLDREKGDLPSFVRERLVGTANPRSALERIEPPYEGYRHTLAILQKYLALAKEPDGEPLPATAKPVDPGAAYPAIEPLARVLRRFGDLPEGAPMPASGDRYTGALVGAVKHFQMRHGLDADGRIGKATLAELNTPLGQRVRQLQLTLERWRWAPHTFPYPPIVVNIPEFRLRALDRDFHPEVEMKVVVGKAYHHQTPVFSAEMTSVGFWPYWDVPVSIERAEVVPKIVKDRSYLVKNAFEVVDAKREVVSTGEVDDALLARLRALELLVRQVPGPKNALGLIKFNFPNQYDIYMHDTPATELFTMSRRDFSHGCIRLENPEELAAWVLRDTQGWTPERIHEAVEGGKTFEVRLAHPIPVLIVYATAVPAAHGEVHFLKDIYGLDAQLETLLAKGYPYGSAAPTSGAPGPHPHE